MVSQGLPVPVGVVSPRRLHPGYGLLIGDERDRVVIRAERGTRQRQAPRRLRKALENAITPAPGIAGVVDLVEDH